ncbi:MBL fold metallo-hydrolase [candidate division KSB1 bacterium]|nr:MBL fold metallo-hydrolase [candidate division KSB1 bacterium]
MQKYIMIILLSFLVTSCSEAKLFDSDTIKTEDGNLIMTFIGHGTLMFEYKGDIIHIDPVSRYADYEKLPKADLILLTHQHGDHLDMTALNHIMHDSTDVILTELCHGKVGSGTVMKNGDTTMVRGLRIAAVPAYNIVHKRDSGEPFHPKGMGNGYVITFADVNVYIAGDTENVPEMKNLKDIDIAFLPMNVPYTMTPQMVADAVKLFQPKILYPYHYGDTNVDDLLELMKDMKGIDVRIRELQ